MENLLVQHVVPYLMGLLNPTSVIGVGCKEGSLLQEFLRNGVAIHGVDVAEYASIPFWKDHPHAFTATPSVITQIRCKNRFDLAIFLGDADALEDSQSWALVQNMCQLADVVLFSPVKEKTDESRCLLRLPSYWSGLFRRNGYVPLDTIRRQIWNEEQINVLHRQSMLVYFRQNALQRFPALWREYMHNGKPFIQDIVHPDMWKDAVLQAGALSKELACSYRPKKVLYTFYHLANFSYVLAHKLARHPHDKAYILLGRTPGFRGDSQSIREFIYRFVDAGVFCTPIYNYDEHFGVRAASLEQAEHEILEGFQDCFSRQALNFKTFDIIYSGTDHIDSLGIYFNLTKVSYHWFELAKDGIVLFSDQIHFHWDKVCPGYRDALLKHVDASVPNPYKSIIMFPDSIYANRYPREKVVGRFHPSWAVTMLSQQDVRLIRDQFGINQYPKQESSTWILVLSRALTELAVWKSFPCLHNQYSNGVRLYYACIQMLCDYNVPNGTTPVLKLHPNVPIAPEEYRLYFDGIFMIHHMFGLPLTKILDSDEIPSYAILIGNTSVGQFDFSSVKLFGLLTWLFPFVMQKMVMILEMLFKLGILAADAPDRIGWLGEHKWAFHYDNNLLKRDIQSLVAASFSGLEKQGKTDYFVQQCRPESIFEELEKHDVVIYSNVWDDMTPDTLNKIGEIAIVHVIRIVKQAIKAKESILCPMHDEYFFVFERESLLDMDCFPIHRINKVMGIELVANRLALEEYLVLRVMPDGGHINGV